MIHLIDCTLRDGGHINKGVFGERVIRKIIDNLVKSNVEIIELGFLKNQPYKLDTTVFSCIFDTKKVIKQTENIEYSLLYDTKDIYDVSKLEECDGTVKHIRVSFHNYDFNNGIEFAREVIKKNYCCHVNPINLQGYSDKELIDILGIVNELHPHTFTIVDTFGAMTECELNRVVAIVDNNLISDIAIGLHLHENLALSFSLAQFFIKIRPHHRNISIDGSLNGMGRVPGNLSIELIMEYLNRVYNKNYDTNPVYDAIDNYILPLKKHSPWGYSLPYALSAQYKLHRTYAEFLVSKSKLKTNDIKNILSNVDNSQKAVYNDDYIQKLYINYLSREIDDTEYQKTLLRELIKYDNILLLAPGYSLETHCKEIGQFIQKTKSVAVISANFDSYKVGIKPDYLFFSNIQRFEQLNESHGTLILTSNLLEYSSEFSFILNFRNLIIENCDNALVMLLKLLKGRKKIYTAGFDGFSKNRNYFTSALNTTFDAITAKENENQKIKEILKNKFVDLDIISLTPSLYMDEHKQFYNLEDNKNK